MFELRKENQEIESISDENIARKLSLSIEDFIRKKAVTTLEAAQIHYNEFISRVDSETTHFDEALILENPLLLISDGERLKEFERVRDHDYNGPSYLNASGDWAELVNTSVDLAMLSDQTQDQDLHVILLRRIFPGNDYTVAQMRRDLRLLQLSPPSRVKDADELRKKLDDLASRANKYAEDSKMRSEAAKLKTRSTVLSRFDEFKKPILRRYEEECKRYQCLREKLISQIANASFDEEILSLFGMPFKDYAMSQGRIYKLDIISYINISPDPTLFETANFEEFDLAEAYSTLLGQKNSFLPLAFKKDASRSSNKKIAELNYERFLSDRNALIEEYKHALENERVTIRGRKQNGESINLSLNQARAERADVMAHPPSWETKYGPHDTYNCFWSFDPEYLNRLNEVIKRKEEEIGNRFQINRRLEVRPCGHS